MRTQCWRTKAGQRRRLKWWPEVSSATARYTRSTAARLPAESYQLQCAETWGFKKVNGRSVYVGHANSAGLVTMNIERLAESDYRAPTPEELAEFTEEKKAAKITAPPTINPTDEDAQALQDIWNAVALAKYNEIHNYRDTPPKVVEVRRMTQAAYSDRAKSGMASIRELTFNGVTFKTRKVSSGFYNYSASSAVVVLTDKPQKPFPAGWNATTPTVTQEPEPVIEPEEAPEEQDDAAHDEQHITEAAAVAAGCLF